MPRPSGRPGDKRTRARGAQRDRTRPADEQTRAALLTIYAISLRTIVHLQSDSEGRTEGEELVVADAGVHELDDAEQLHLDAAVLEPALPRRHFDLQAWGTL